MLMVDYYKPFLRADLIGNQANCQHIQDFLEKWDQTMILAKNAKTKSQMPKRAILLSGPPGIGKTTSIHVVARELGWVIVEMNASDTRSKKSLQERVSVMLGNRSLTEFFGVKKRTVVVMDEIDGMSTGDRGGMAEMIKLIASTKVPIVCICNDRASQKIRSLASHCHDLRYRRPTAAQIAPRLQAIAHEVGLPLDRQTIEKMAESMQGDIRQMLNMMQLWATRLPGGVDMSFESVASKLKSASKDFTLNMWDEVGKLFLRPRSQEERRTFIMRGTDAYFSDVALVPLMVQDNYLRSSVRARNAIHLMRMAAEAADFLSDSDLVDGVLRSRQDYSLMPIHAALSSIAPAYIMAGGVRGMKFPQWLGKNSTRNKNKRQIADLRSHISLRVSTSSSALNLDYVPLLRHRVVQPLVDRGKNGIDDVIDTMQEYQLARDDWDVLNELGSAFATRPPPNPVTAVKAAFTRAYSKAVNITYTAQKEEDDIAADKSIKRCKRKAKKRKALSSSSSGKRRRT